MHCPDCERIDEHIFDTTTFWIHLPTQDSFTKVAVGCGESGYKVNQFSRSGIKVTLERDEISRFITTLFGQLSQQELAHTNFLTTEGTEPANMELGRVMTGDVFVNRFQGRWIIDALQEERYEAWFQPIVSGRASTFGEPFAHEALFRMYDDHNNLMPPSLVFGLADKSNLLFNLDLAARRCAVETASAAKLPGKLFINFNPTSIYDPAYCLRTTAAAVEELGLQPSDIVFELTETHEAQDKAHLQGILAFYRSAGFNVALDDIGSGYSGLNVLTELRPDYAKIDMELIRDIDTDVFKQTIVRNLLNIARESAIKTIAEGIETEAEAEWLKQAGADYLQGYYFGRPAPVQSA